MIKLDEILRSIYERNKRRITGTDWLQLTTSVEHELIATTPFDQHFRSEFTFTFKVLSEYVLKDRPQVISNAARHFHKAMYGDLITRIVSLKSELHYMSKEDVQKELAEILEDLQV